METVVTQLLDEAVRDNIKLMEVAIVAGFLAGVIVDLFKPIVKRFLPEFWSDWALRAAAALGGALVGWAIAGWWEGFAAGLVGGSISTYIYGRFMGWVRKNIAGSKGEPNP